MSISSAPRNKFRKSILVVEDEPQVRDMLVKALSSRYIVHQAADGLAASELLGRVATPDLMVCDVMMPRVDGLSLARLVRSNPQLKHMPIIFLTAKTSPQSIIAGIQAGAKHYVHKPFSVSELLEKIAKLLE